MKPSMKPFDLQAALAGDLVVLRNGATAKIGAYNPDAWLSEQVIGWDSEGRLRGWSVEGVFLDEPSGADIIGMAPKKQSRTGWVNVYEKWNAGYIHPTKKEADRSADSSRIACVELTYEWEE